MKAWTAWSVLCALVLFLGCKKEETASQAIDVSPQCDAPDGYIAFDVGNHQPQDTRLNTFDKMINAMAAAVMADGTVDGSAFKKAKSLYLDAAKSADLQTKVLERLDEHVKGDPPQGERLDETLLAFLDFGAAATTAREAEVAAVWVEITLQEFFFLSVYHELIDPTREHWDEAFGYFGSHSDNDESGLQGLAMMASLRDATNGTNLGAEIFNDLIDGACVLDEALTKADAETLPLKDMPELEGVVEDIDTTLQKVLAYTLGHDAMEIVDLLEAGGTDVDDLTVEAAELVAIATPLIRLMNDRGGASADRADQLQAIIDTLPLADGVPDSAALADDSWIADFDPTAILELIEAEYDIDVKG